MDVVIERRQDPDAEEIFRLYGDVFGQTLTEGSRRRWRWQYLESPEREAQGPAIWVAREGDLVLGQYASMPVRLWWGDREVRSSWGMDVFLRPQARGKGIGARLFTTWSDHVEVALGLGLTESSYGLFQKLRYDDVGPVPFYERVLDARAVLSRRTGPVLGALGAPLVAAGLGLLHPERGEAPADVTVGTVEAFGPAYDGLWEKARASHAMCVRRDAAYLNWKYVACPHQAYVRHEARRGEEVVGFAVSRVHDYQGIRLGWVVDLFADASDEGARAALLSAVLEGFRAAGVARAQAFAMHGALGATLVRFGFARGRSPMQFCVRSRVARTPFETPDRWHVVFGDSDMDR